LNGSPPRAGHLVQQFLQHRAFAGAQAREGRGFALGQALR
jgi:hypothetical protein